MHDISNHVCCDSVFPSRDDHVLLDLIEMAILDYLSYHVDSKYYRITNGPGTGLMIHLDHGRRYMFNALITYV